MRRLLLRWPSLKWRLPLAAMALLTMRPISPFVSVSRGQGQSQSRVACAAKGYGVLRRLMQLQDDFLSLPKTKEFVLDRDWPKDRLLNVEEFLQHQESERPCPVLDVRSPKEFHKGHVPGARNLPLLNDDERAAVGTMFAQIGAKEAFDLALESVHPKLATLLRQAGENVDSEAHEAKLLLYCKRGGMRSQSMAKLLSRHGLDVMVLTGGYKAFRTWAEQTLREKPQKVCVIAGATGSGKTDILEEIQRQGLGQVINLEAMARHKGSVFGALGEEAQPSSEQLRNDLAIKWSKLCSSKWVYLEDEGARIGEAVLPSSLYQRLRGASLVLHLDVAFALRATRSLELYGPFGAEALCSAVENFRHRMGHRYTDELQELLRQGQLRPVCEEILRNYDKAYDYHLNRGRRKDQILRLEVSSLNCSAVAHDVVVPAAAAREAAAPEDTARLPSGESKSAQVREAKCFCGAVISRATGDPAAVSICHCSICRRLSGAPFVASAVFLPQRVQFLSSLDGGEPQLTELQTSKEALMLTCLLAVGWSMTNVILQYIAMQENAGLHSYFFYDVALAFGALLSLLCGGCLRFSTPVAECEAMLDAFTEGRSLYEDWLSKCRWDALLVLIIWALSVVERTRELFADGIATLQLQQDVDQQELVYNLCNLGSFAVSGAVLLSCLFRIMRVCRGFYVIIDDFSFNLVTTSDLCVAEQDWNLLQALLRRSCHSLQYLFIVLQSTIVAALILGVDDFYRLNKPTLLISGACVLIGLAQLFLCAASVTDHCERLPPFVNSLGFGRSLDADRLYLVEYMFYSQAGFYIFEVRVTRDMVLKAFYISGMATFYFATKVMAAGF